MKNSKLIAPVIILGALAIGAATFGTNALASYGQNEDQRSQQAQALANKLGVDESKVSTAMDEIRAERQKERQTEVSTKLDQAVKDGVLTADQKEKLIKKQSELRESKGQNRSEMEQWFKDNGIDFDKIHDYIGFGQGKGMGRGMNRS